MGGTLVLPRPQQISKAPQNAKHVRGFQPREKAVAHDRIDKSGVQALIDDLFQESRQARGERQ
jgi:hypothetical protein